MSETLSSNIWLYKEPDNRCKDKVLEYITTQDPTEGEIVVLHCSEACNFEDSTPLLYYIFQLCQRFKVFKNEKTMVLNPNDFLQATELCLERLKSEYNTTETEKDEYITQCYKTYINSLKMANDDSTDKLIAYVKKFMIQSNCIEIWQMINDLQMYKANNSEFSEYISKLKFLLIGTAEVEIFREVINLFGNCNDILSITVETPLNISLQGSPPSKSPEKNSSSEIQVISEAIDLEELSSYLENTMQLCSATKEYVEDVITAFLSLLVNSRNELALSKVVISPFIDLSHEAFTHLKHLSVEKEMPMCQTAISYVTRVRLGGKGYAPPEDCPLMPHLKSLELFVDTLNQMQTIVEEDAVPKSAMKRLINILKKKLLKCENNKLKQTAIETAAENLHSVTGKILKLTNSKQCDNAAPQICQEALDVLYYLVNYLNCLCWTFSFEKIIKQKHYERTPINLPPLLGYFRSPEEESAEEDNSVVNEDSIISNSSSALGFPAPLMSYFHHSDNSCSVSMTCVENQTPTKTSFKDCISKEDSINEIEITDAKQKPINRKRSILGDITNEKAKDSAKKIKIAPTKAKESIKIKEQNNVKKAPKKEVKKTKLSKKFKLIEGQGKITNFFIMGKK